MSQKHVINTRFHANFACPINHKTSPQIIRECGAYNFKNYTLFVENWRFNNMNCLFNLILFSSWLSSVHGSLRTQRQLSFEKIMKFTPITQVTDHVSCCTSNAGLPCTFSFILISFLTIKQASIDLDQQEIENLIAEGNYSEAQNVYEQGAHSKSIAVLTLSTDLRKAVPEGTKIEGRNMKSRAVSGKAYKDYEAGATIIEVQYDTSGIQASYVGCQVGGSSEPVLDGCKYELLHSFSLDYSVGF
jgi:hypothetical protein